MQKILILARTKNSDAGGEGTFLKALLSDKEVIHKFVFNHFYVEGHDPDCLDGVKIKDEYIFFRFFRFLKLAKVVLESDVVHINCLNNISLSLLACYIFLFKRNIAVSFHGNLSGTKWDGFLLLRKFRKWLVINIVLLFSKKMIFLTEYQKNDFLSFTLLKGFFLKKSLVIGNFIEKGIIAQSVLSEKDCDVLFVGRLSKNKGVHDLFEVAGSMPDLTFFAVGPYSDILLKSAPKNIRFFGNLDRGLVMHYLERAGLLFSPSYDETFGLSILEAIAKGVPVLSSDLPQVKEWFRDGENGFLFPLGDTQQMIRLIRELNSNKGLWKRISENNLTRASDFTAEACIPKYVSLYQELNK